MVAHFMGDHIGLGKVAGGGIALGQLAEKTDIQIDLAIGRAIERPARRAGHAAGRAHASVEQYQGRVLILAASLLEQLAPGIFGVAEDGADKVSLLVVGHRRALAAGGRAFQLAGQLAENLHWVLAGDQAEGHHQHYGAQGQAFAAAPTTAAARHHVVAAPSAFPEHDSILLSRS